MDKIFIGNFDKGLTQDRLPFFIDNNSFPTMYNFYSWRGRARRKRGTIPVGRLAIQFSNTSAGSVTFAGPTGTYSLFANINVWGTVKISTLQLGANITPGSASFPLVITINGAGNTLTDTLGTGVFVVTGAGPITAATINYATGVLTLSGSAAALPVIIVSGSYFPGLPVMGLRDFIPVLVPTGVTTGQPYPQLLAFDTEYSYQNFTSSALASTSFFNTNYFKNTHASYTDMTTAYVPKTTQTPFIWTGQNWQQFWTTNFEQALWATNGNPGMQVQVITTIVRVSATKITFNVANSPAVIGDWVFVNEILDTGGAGDNSSTINGQTGYVSAIGVGTVTVVFPNANISAASGTYSGGIMQYLTNIVPSNFSPFGPQPSMGDGIKWYDGDPTATTGLPSSSSAGWVNFNPPLSVGGQIIDNYTSGTTKPFYLVGCKAMLPYKDRMLFFGVYIATSAMAIGGTSIYLQDTVVWSWNGAPYYTASFTTPVNTNTIFFPMTTPGDGLPGLTHEGAAVNAYYTDQTGFGGYLPAGIQQPFITAGLNEDVLIVSFTNKQTRLVYRGDDIDPFRFFSINSEIGASATFSAITLDRGVVTFGTYGFALTTQNSTERIDLQIPDQAFKIESTNFGVNRINSVRDFFKEWLYFCYQPEGQPSTCLFPTQTFFMNYRDNTWALFDENFTAHGSFWRNASLTWSTLPYSTWDEWTDSWDSPNDQALFPSVVAGTPQGFVLQKAIGTGEAPSGYITNAVAYTSSNPNLTQITSINHCVQQGSDVDDIPSVGDYLFFSGALGITGLNGLIGQVFLVIDANNFVVDIPFTSVNLYQGLGVFSRLTLPVLQSKQFPSYWNMGRKTRIGAQQYLFDNSGNPDGQVTVNLYLSMDPSTVYNQGPIVPDDNADNNTLIYSQLVYTCQESTNLGLTPANTNLQMPTAQNQGQKQIWHRMNTSLVGDTVQFGITLSDEQMRNRQTAESEITLHAVSFDIYPSSYLS